MTTETTPSRDDLLALLQALDGSSDKLAEFQLAVRAHATILHDGGRDVVTVEQLEIMAVLYLVPTLTTTALDVLLARPCASDLESLAELGYVSREQGDRQA